MRLEGDERTMTIVTIGLELVAATLLVATTSFAQPMMDVKAAAEPITKQLEAFRRDDYDTAYSFAAADIKEMFDRAAFERMVKSGYPEIAHSTFALIAHSAVGPDGHVYVRVKIRGANGNSIEAVYDMIQEAGGWRINGVATKPDPGLVLAPFPSGARAG
jgi:ABC-type transporter MlaC component